MHVPSRAAAAALAALFAFAVAGAVQAKPLGGPHPAPGHNIFHPAGVAPGQGANGGGGGGGGGKHHKHGDQQPKACNTGGVTLDQQTDTTKDTKKGKKKKKVQTVDCIPAK